MPAEWFPSRLLLGHTRRPYAIIILNQPINASALNAVIEQAALLVCADAGANRLSAYDANSENGHVRRIPDAIVGDLDSIDLDVEKHYRSRGVAVAIDPDQYSTDFTKCLKWLRKKWTENTGSKDVTLDIVVFGGLGGRVDQGFSQIHHLYMAANDDSLLQGRMYLLSEQSLSFVLDEGMNVIHTEPDTFTENIGIIPVLGEVFLTTKGFEWDVKDWKSQFGGQMSTSNHIRSDQMTIEVRGGRPLLTIELVAHLVSAGP